MIRVWALRLFLLGLVAMIPLRLAGEAAGNPSALEDRTRQVFEQAGYHTRILRPRDAADHRSVTVARSPDCAADVVISGVTIAGMMDDDLQANGGAAPVYAFGDWSGTSVSRVRLVIEVIKLRLRNAITFGRTPWASPVVLVLSDPSACLAIAQPDLARIWRADRS